MFIISNKSIIISKFIGTWIFFIPLSSVNCSAQGIREECQNNLSQGYIGPDSLFEAFFLKLYPKIEHRRVFGEVDEFSLASGIKKVETRVLSFNKKYEDAIFDTLARYSPPKVIFYEAYFLTLDSDDEYLYVYCYEHLQDKKIFLDDVRLFNSPQLSGSISKKNMIIYVYGDYPSYIKKTGIRQTKSYIIEKDMIIPYIDGGLAFVFKIDNNSVVFKYLIPDG